MQLSDYGMSRSRGFLSHYEIDEVALPSTFDGALQKMEQQIRRYKQKLQDHRRDRPANEVFLSESAEPEASAGGAPAARSDGPSRPKGARRKRWPSFKAPVSGRLG